MSRITVRVAACSSTSRFANSAVNEADRRLLALALRKADEMRPAWRASEMAHHEPAQVTALFADMLRVEWVVGVGVATAVGGDFIVAGLTERGRAVLTIIEDRAAWVRLEEAAAEIGMALDVEGM